MITDLASHAPPSAAAAPAHTHRSFLWQHPLVSALLFLAAVLAAYAPALGGQFFWDDTFLVQNNPLIRSPLFVLEAFRHTLFGDSSEFYRPTQTLTYLFDYWCGGLAPFGYHLTNTVIHAGNGFLLFLLLRRGLPALMPVTQRSSTQRWALALALLWALHPVHSAAVAYVSGRADSLAMTFCLLAWLSCERALDSARPAARAGWATGALASLLLGLCAKEIAFVWLVLFTGWLFVLRPFPGVAPRTARSTKLAVLGLGAITLVCYLGLRHLPPPHPAPPPYPPMPARLVLMLRALGDYARLMVWPDRLYMERQVFAATGLANPQDPAYYHALAVLGALMLAAFGAGVSWPGRGRRLRRVGAAWFLCGFLPVSNLFLLNASVAEHWLYLPSVGFLLFLAGGVLDVPWERLPASFAHPRFALLTVSVAALALGGRTWFRAHDWMDGETFYRQTMRDGGDFPRMREGLALACMERGDCASAVKLLGNLAALYPQAVPTRVNLATAQMRLGRTEAARTLLQQVAADLDASENRRADPREYTVVIRALDRLELPSDPTWTTHRHHLLDAALSRFPASWDLLSLKIAEQANANNLPAALALTNDFVETHWWHLPARLELARLFAMTGQADAALAAWRQAARFDVYSTEAMSAAASFCLTQGRLEEALVWQQNAVERQPDSLRQHLLLAHVFAVQGRTADADHERVLAAQLAAHAEG